MSVADGIDGVNARGWWKAPAEPRPTMDDSATKREVLLVDQTGRPLIIRQPRPVGFRPR